MAKVIKAFKVRHYHILLLLTGILLLGFTWPQNNPAPDDPGGYRIRRVVLDAGHGGKDPGAVGAITTEKKVALSVVLKVGAYIKQYLPDVEVIYTRDNDVFVPLAERAAIANRHKADLFISGHCNAAENKAAYGTETWVMGMHKSEDNLEVAKRENSVILLEDDYQETYDYDPNNPLSHILFSLYQNAHLEQSLTMADFVQEQFRDRVQRRDRGVHQAGFMVLYRTSMPSVLVELGFLSNAQEEQFLAGEQGQDLLASAIFRAFRDYKNQMESVNTRIAGQTASGTTNTGNIDADLPVTTSTNMPSEHASVTFSVQVAVRSQIPSYSDSPYNGRGGFFTEKVNQVYRIYWGQYRTKAEADSMQQEARRTGFPDAFVVAFRDGKRIDLNEVSTLQKP